ncbi:hypothetical protein ABTU92_29975, partial [Rhodoplanes sp. SY1]
SSPLAHPVRPRGTVPLQTLGDARAWLLGLPPTEASRPAWQRAAGLLIAAAEDGTMIGEATDQLERALFLGYRLDLSATE